MESVNTDNEHIASDLVLIERYSSTSRQIKIAMGDLADLCEFDDTIFQCENEKKDNSENENNQNDNLNVTNEDNKIIVDPVPLVSEKKHKIVTDENSFMKFPDNYSTDDEDVKLIADLMNETFDQGWQKAVDEKGANVITKNVGDKVPHIIKATTIIEGFTKEEIFEAIVNFDLRKQWDKMIKSLQLIAEEENCVILHQVINPPIFFISSRDYVLKRKIWRNFPDEDSMVVHIKSTTTTDPKYQEKPEPVRGEMHLTCVYLKSISQNPLKVRYCALSQINIKGNMSLSMVNKQVPSKFIDIIQLLKDGLKKVYNKK